LWARSHISYKPVEKRAEAAQDVVPDFAGSERAKKIVRLAEASLANSPLKKPGMVFSADSYVQRQETSCKVTVQPGGEKQGCPP
jgi:hypothetical protein